MKKHQLLEKAMRDYPAGTKFKSVYHSTDHVSTGVFYISDGDGKDASALYCSIDGIGRCLYCFDRKEWAIPVAPSILSGKVAIQVSNEREFKLLMEHYEAKGWKSFSLMPSEGQEPVNCRFSSIQGRFGTYGLVTYGDRFGFPHKDVDVDWLKADQYKQITFASFAKEVGVEVPVFAFKSFDSVPMYYGDNAIVVAKEHGGNWSFITEIPLDKENVDKLSVTIATNIFSTKEAAEFWIKEQNKPKHVTVQLFSHKDYKSAEITPNKITIRDADSIYYLKPSDLEDMLHAYKSLQQ